ncbi:MAG: FAD-binding protein [Firmicutes bacterium]|nr:FAD-binding protein [[Eubacterium] siraeum]MCM1488292.1 FAD-binding protein [Bacillota bacterium]
MQFEKYDVIIVGSGVAGLYCALNLNRNLKILMISKKEVTLCNSALAQGGVAAVMNPKDDDYSLHIKDTLIAGGYKNDMNNVRILVEQGPTDVKNLIKYGVDFDRNSDGSVNLTLEGGHSRHRIAHHKDSTGFEIVTALIDQAIKLKNLTILENAHLLALDKCDEDFRLDIFKSGKHNYYTTKAVVLATGGIGRVYDFTTNSAIATGDGIQFAYNVGARIKHLSYIQFHPTAFADRKNRECFLVSEAVRGEGAYLLNGSKERFMHKYEPERKELAPRDVVSKCMMKEQEAVGSDEFWLDISYKDPEFVKDRFPMIYQRVLEKGYDMTKEPIPIYPCQHYLMGGIDVDGNGATTVKGLYAAGECAHTGVHGLNRLASNSLLEALVFSRLIAEQINLTTPADKDYSPVEAEVRSPEGEDIPKGIRTEIRHIMQKSYFVVPNYEEAAKGHARIKEIKEMLESGNYALTPDYIEAKSLATVACIVLGEVMESAGGSVDE